MIIHCLLYCFTGTRFEKEEGEIIIKLRKIYEGKTLPIILVLTQDLEDEEQKNDELYNSINNLLDEKCDEHLSSKPKSISFIKVLAKEKKISKKFIIPSKGLDILLKYCLEKGEYSSKYAVLSSIKYSAEKKIREDFLKIKNDIMNERERFLKELFQNNQIERIFERIIEKVYMTFSLIKNKDFVNEQSYKLIKLICGQINKLILDKEDKVFRDYFEPKAKNISSILINKQINISKIFDFGLGERIKDLNQFSYEISNILRASYKSESESNAIKNAALLISPKIIDIFMKLFIESYIHELNSDDNKMYIENQINKGFSNELKSKMEGLINELKNSQESQTSTPMSK